MTNIISRQNQSETLFDFESEEDAQQRLEKIHQLLREQIDARIYFIKSRQRAKLEWELSGQIDRRLHQRNS